MHIAFTIENVALAGLWVKFVSGGMDYPGLGIVGGVDGDWIGFGFRWTGFLF